MECADLLVGARRRCSSSSWKAAEQWRKARNVIRTCYRPARLAAPSTGGKGMLRRSPSSVAIEIPHERDSDADLSGSGFGGAAAVFSVTADDESFKGLVKKKSEDCFRRLGGGAGIAAALASDVKKGIHGNDNDVRRRQEAFGVNTYWKAKRTKSFFDHVLDVLLDPLVLVLLVCAAMSLGIGIKRHGLKDGWYDGASIFVAVFLMSAVSAISNHLHAQTRFEKLARDSSDNTVTVVRDAQTQEVSIFDIVVGDVVLLKTGEVVPADGVFLRGGGLVVDERGMTGDPHPVNIDAEKNPFLTCGVKVIDGHCRMLVTAVGTDTEWGELMDSLTMAADEPTPLQYRLDGLTSRVGKVTIAVPLLLAFTVLAAHQSQYSVLDSLGKPLLVLAMPEVIPIAGTLALGFSVKRLVEELAVVLRLSACETMGTVTAICTHMTGALTLNKMEVTQFWIGTGQPEATAAVAESVVSLLQQGVGLSTTRGGMYKPDDLSPPQISGSPTEKALRSWAVECLGMDADALKRSCEVLQQVEAGEERSRVMVRDTAGTGAVIAHWKGAARRVLASCSVYVDARGAAHEIGIQERVNLEKVIDDMAVSSLRCVAFAYKQVNGNNGEQSTMDDDKGLTLLGLVGLKDPCRPDTKSAIDTCTEAGVKVKMVTNDDIDLACAIAMECGLVSINDPTGIIIEGPEFRAMSPEQQLVIVDDIRVMARALPKDKLLLVRRLKQKGHVVAAMGFGTDDAPTLLEADVGLSMGINATGVAKKSSDIIILDGSFSTAVTAVRWGRCVYNNIHKFIQFHITANIAILIINSVSMATTGKMPLTTVQHLWIISLAINTMGALALATDTPTEALMRRPPIGREAPLIGNAMWRNLVLQAVSQAAVLLTLQYPGHHTFGTDQKANRAVIFNTFVLWQVFNLFNAREIEMKNVFVGVLKSKMFLAIVAVTLLLQVVMVEALTRFAGIERLDLGQWGACIAIAALSWPIAWAIKFIPVPDQPFQEIVTSGIRYYFRCA